MLSRGGQVFAPLSANFDLQVAVVIEHRGRASIGGKPAVHSHMLDNLALGADADRPAHLAAVQLERCVRAANRRPIERVRLIAWIKILESCFFGFKMLKPTRCNLRRRGTFHP